MPGETSRGTSGDSRIIGSRPFGSLLTRDNPAVGIVAEGVPPDISQSEFSSSGANIVLLDWTGVVTAHGDRAGEHPPFLRFRASLFPAQQDRSETRIERKIVFRILGLDLVDNSVTTPRVPRIVSSAKFMSGQVTALLLWEIRIHPCKLILFSARVY